MPCSPWRSSGCTCHLTPVLAPVPFLASTFCSLSFLYLSLFFAGDGPLWQVVQVSVRERNLTPATLQAVLSSVVIGSPAAARFRNGVPCKKTIERFCANATVMSQVMKPRSTEERR